MARDATNCLRVDERRAHGALLLRDCALYIFPYHLREKPLPSLRGPASIYTHDYEAIVFAKKYERSKLLSKYNMYKITFQLS